MQSFFQLKRLLELTLIGSKVLKKIRIHMWSDGFCYISLVDNRITLTNFLFVIILFKGLTP